MVVDDLDVPCSAFTPDEADPPLIVDADTRLSSAIAFERLQAIAGRNAQIIQRLSGVKHLQFGACPPADLWIESLDAIPGK